MLRRPHILPLVTALASAMVILGVYALSTASGADTATQGATCYSGPLGAEIAIDGGDIKIGSDAHYPEEAPVTIRRIASFSIDLHEVTNAQFREFVEATGYVTSAESARELGFEDNGSAVFANGLWRFVPGASWRHPEGPQSTIEGRDFEPVVHVSRSDAEAFAAWAGRRLPTEAEFEYAASLGRSAAVAARSPPPSTANTWQGLFPFADTAEDGFAGRAAIGCFPADAIGLYDLIGNVWEWTSDPYFPAHDHPAAQQPDQADDGYDPRQPGLPVGTIKGGSYLCAENFCRRARPSARHPQDVGLGSNHIGFRTVKSIVEAPLD